MRGFLIAFLSFASMLCATAAARAAEPEGALLCAAKGGGFDCANGKCNPSRVTAGGDIRLDFGAKSMCALRGGECQQPKTLHHAMIEEPGKTIVAAASGDNATMLFRIGQDMKMAMVFVIGTNRVLSFEGECRKP
ncbi:MAG TPA: hypothetical protein VIF14_07320 [Alphaproteobacteria bacterium]|jgi:hypothetical protein